MSWNIFIYAEFKSKNDLDWKPLVQHCVCDNFKYYDDDFYDSLYSMNAEDTSIESLKKIDENVGGNDKFSVRYCDINLFRNHYNNIINNFNSELKTVYTALGINSICLDEEAYWCLDEEEDCDEDYDNEDDSEEKIEKTKNNNNLNNPWIKYMTFPVNKKLLVNLSYSFKSYTKAVEMINLCDTLSCMSEHYDDEIRLIFAVL